MHLNFDVWHEIISYFAYPEDEHTLRSLAVLSRIPSDLALDVIWRNGDNFLKIASVINSFATSPDEPFLEYTSRHSCDLEKIGGSHQCLEENSAYKGFPVTRDVIGNSAERTWVLNKPLPHGARNRALQYLARIEKFTVLRSRPRKEDQLWTSLSAFLECPGPLLPRLRHLKIHNAYDTHMDCLALLLPPSLRFLEITAIDWPEDRLTLPVLNLAKFHGCDLQVFSYNGGPGQRAPDFIALFKNLQTVQFPLKYPLQDVGSSLTITEFLAALPSLRSLTCNPSVFVPCSTEDKFCHTNIQDMRVLSPASVLREFFRVCMFPSVTEVTIEKDNTDFDNFDTTSTTFEGLDKSCPNIQKLDLRVHPFSSSKSQPFDFKHLAPLLSLPIKVFDLKVGKLNFLPADFRAISQSWRNLHSFHISATCGFDFNPLSSLVAFSNHPHLTHLDLNLRTHCLLDNIADVPGLMAAPTPTPSTPSHPCTLYFVSLGGPRQLPPTTRAEKRSLVECLLRAFPGLKLEPKYNQLQTSCRDGQMLIEFQEILSELRKEGGYSDGLV